jgi:PAS domain S-box-containing protein
LQKGELDHYEMDKRYIHKQGSIVWVRLSVSALIDAATNSITSVSIIEDITERKRAEQALRESEARFRAIFEGASIGIAVFEPGGTAVSVNPALQHIVGYDESELIGIRFRKFTHEDDRELTVSLFEELQSGKIDHYQLDKRYIHKDGSIVWAQLSMSALRHSDGQGVMAVALIDDITEWKLADDALRESEGRFRAIFEGASMGIAVVDGVGGVVSANPAFERMVGYESDELLGMPFRAFTHPDDVGQNLELFQQLMANTIDHYQYDKRYVRKDGDIVWVRMNVSSFPDSDQRLAVALVEDITQAKLAEAALRQSEAHNKALLDSMPDLMFLLDKNGVFLDYRAPSHEDLFVPPELFMGKRIYEVLPEALTSSLHVAINRAFENGETQFFEYDLAAGDNDPQTFESRIVAFDWDKVLIISRDVTERKRTETAIQELNADLERRVKERTSELAAANERLTELDRLKSKFIADVSHELRTPLAVLNTRVYLLENGLPEKRTEYLTGLRGQIERLTQFVNTVLDLSRLELGKGKIEFEPVDLNEVVDQVTAALEPRAEASGLRLNVAYASPLPPVQGEFNQLAQVATNLIANAINYTANGHIDVSTGIEGHMIYLRVQDTGMGIASDDIPHLFERFYRGERAGQTKIAGSGLGLSIVKEIIDLHNGDIQVESQVGRGTTFLVTLPIAGKPEPNGFVP